MDIVALKMSLVVAMACILTVIMWLVLTKTRLKDASALKRRIIISVVFSAAAILSTHLGVKTDLAVLNVRDAFPLIAALLFDPWAGVIVGFAAGIERFIAGTWFGIGSYTVIACSVSTVIAGATGTLLSIRIFEGRKPSAFYGFTTAAMVEVFHMLMIMVTHMGDPVQAFAVTREAAAPMIIANAVALMLSALFVSLLSRQLTSALRRKDKSERPITLTFQIWLLAFIVAMFALTFSFTFIVETQVTLSNEQATLALNADDVESEIAYNASELANAKGLLANQALTSSRSVANDVTYAKKAGTLSNDLLEELASSYNVYEINVVDKDGIIAYSTNPDYIGFDMHSGEQSSAFLVLLDGGTQTDLVQDFQPISYSSDIYVMYAGTAIEDGFIQVGFDSTRIAEYDDLADVTSVASNRRIGQAGYVLLTDDGTIMGGPSDYVGKSLSSLGIDTVAGDGDTFFLATVDGVASYCMIRALDDYDLVLVIPDSEVYADRDLFAYETAFIYILLFSIIFMVIYQLVKSVIVKNLDRVNSSLARITSGGLDEVVDVRSSAEFTSLSRDINSTVSTLKRYIAEAAARIDAELEFAREIQVSALPSGDPFPNRDDFDLNAVMFTAKEVGGDFYDYFAIDGRHLAIVVADVSGKGIPAALFMMKSKTLIKSIASEGDLSPASVLAKANQELCDGNDTDMFVTAWLGILDLATGTMRCTNAGHEFPAIRRGKGDFELFKDRHGFVLGGMGGLSYKDYELTLHGGDELFLYTDGVPEATNASNELYGNDRMIAATNASKDLPTADFLVAIKADIDRFVGDAPQFDDITMICLRLMKLGGTLEP